MLCMRTCTRVYTCSAQPLSQAAKSSPGLLGSRHWSRVARTKFRAFNELPHQLRLRLQYTTEPVEYFLGQFPSPPLIKLARYNRRCDGMYCAR